MAANKQPIFTVTPILKCTKIPQSDITNAFDPTDPKSNSIEFYSATDPSGTLIERITIQPMIKPGGSYNNMNDKLLYIIVSDGIDDPVKSSILATKHWPAFDIDGTFTELPYWELTFTGGMILTNGSKLYFHHIKANGGLPDINGDGVLITVEGSTYTA